MEFADAAVGLYTDAHVWKNAQAQGKTLINTLYSQNTLKKVFVDRLTEIQTEIAQHRLRNFMGSLLQHQSLHAATFMGKWIEEKNKT